MLNTDYQNDVLTVYLSGDIDHNRASTLRASIDSQLNALMPKALELDFSKVSFMDSSGIGLIMGRYRSAGLVGATLKIINIPPQLQRIVELSGVSALGVLK